MRKQWFVLLVAVFASITLWGCGSGGGSGDSVGVANVDDIAAVGVANCSTCHDAETADWLASSAHGNSNDRPSLSYFGHDPATDCSICHDPSGEGVNLRAVFASEDNRPVVGCEECHGGGSAHRGIGPLPYAWPDAEQCATCHDGAHGDFDLATAVASSAHNNSDDLHASATRCQRCHTTEGSILLSQYTGDAEVMHLMDDIAPIGAEEDLHPVTCVACHETHTDALRADSFIENNNSLVIGDWDPNGNGSADQFDFCTSCHTYYNQEGILIGSGSVASGTAPFYHNTAWYRTLTTTHFDDPATGVGLAENIVEGYVIRAESANPCFDCHDHEFRSNTNNADEVADPSDADMGSTIHSQWASSSHGGRLLNQVRTAAEAVECDPNDPETSRGRCPDIVDAAMAAGVDSTSGDAWIHYNWDKTNDTVPGDRTGRASCQMCHTATGAMNYLNDPANYDQDSNDYSHLDNWNATDGSTQNELLYCWGCHSNSSGELRNPGAITRPYTVSSIDVILPDVGNSNVCINCHGALGNVEGYALAGDPATAMLTLNSGFGPNTKNVTNAHYLVASATIYAADTKIGYEYQGPSYAPVGYFAHDGIGLNADTPETGAGPCAACHMETVDTHTFEVVDKDDMGVITALNSTSCIECHTGAHGPGLVVEDTTTENGLQTAAAAAAFLEEEAEGYHEALAMLLDAIEAKGIIWTGDYPYFDTNDSLGSGGTALSWINEGTFGAAHNYNYLHHEPGAYAHNRIYAKRLIFDSLDWLDDGMLNGTISTDATAYPAAHIWLRGDDGEKAIRASLLH
jgi:Cytochrome c554 and c-prime